MDIENNRHTVNDTSADPYSVLSRQNIIARSLIAFHDIDDSSNLINNILKDILDIYNACRTYIFTIDYDLGIQRYRYEQCAEGIEPEIDSIKDLPLSATPVFLKSIENGQPFSVDRLENIKDSAPLEYELMVRQNIKSLLIYPITENNKLIGYLGIDIVNQYRTWSNDDRTILMSLANIISAIHTIRYNYEQKNKQLNELADTRLAQLNSIYKHLQVAVMLDDKDGNTITYNQRYIDLFGKDNDKVIWTNYFVNKLIPEHIKEKVRAGKDVTYEISIKANELKGVSDRYNADDNIILQIRTTSVQSANGEIINYLHLIDDITERRQNENKIIQNSNLLQAMYDSIPLGIELYNKEGKLYSINDFEIKQMGILDKNSFLGVSFYDNPNISNEIKERLRNGENFHFTFDYDFDLGNKQYCKTSIKGIRQLHVHFTSLKGYNNEYEGFMLVNHDITDIIKQNIELQRTQDFLEIAMESGEMNSWLYNVNTKNYSLINGKTVLGKTMSLKELFSCVNEEDRQLFTSTRNALLAGDLDTGNNIFKIKSIDNKYIYCQLYYRTIKENGKVIYIVGTTKNVTEMYERRLQLEEYSRKTSLITTACNIVQWDYDPYRHVINTYTNSAILPNKDIYIETFMKYVHPDDIKSTNELFIRMDNYDEDTKGFRFRFKLPGYTEYRNVILNGVPVRNEKGVIYKYTGIRRDITEQLRTNEELELAKNKAEESDKLKSAFLANVSHEIRTPLNAIVGFSELVKDSDSEEEKEKFFKIVTTNNDILLNLIGDILDLSKIEAGTLTFNKELVDISHLFDSLTTSLRQKLTNQNIQYIVDNPYNHCTCSIDRNRFAQVLTNYVTNAIKYTVSGSITIGYKQYSSHLYIYVTDTGIGIPDNKKDRVFGRFEKLDSFAQGNGLGLSICKALVEADGGEVGFESEDGKGSTFWATIPTSFVNIENKLEYTNTNNISFATKTNSTPKETNNNNMKILVAEDIDSNFLLVKAILKDYNLTRTVNGEDTVNMVKGNNFDLVLMDIKMPIMNGIEATQAIRKFNTQIPIVAVTANAFDSDRDNAMSAGCNGFVTKPLRRQNVIDIINQYSK